MNPDGKENTNDTIDKYKVRNVRVYNCKGKGNVELSSLRNIFPLFDTLIFRKYRTGMRQIENVL